MDLKKMIFCVSRVRIYFNNTTKVIFPSYYHWNVFPTHLFSAPTLGEIWKAQGQIFVYFLHDDVILRKSAVYMLCECTLYASSCDYAERNWVFKDTQRVLNILLISITFIINSVPWQTYLRAVEVENWRLIVILWRILFDRLHVK